MSLCVSREGKRAQNVGKDESADKSLFFFFSFSTTTTTSKSKPCLNSFWLQQQQKREEGKKSFWALACSFGGGLALGGREKEGRAAKSCKVGSEKRRKYDGLQFPRINKRNNSEGFFSS